jgi:hypothetical protein
LPDGKTVSIHWQREAGDPISFEISAPVPIWLHATSDDKGLRIQGERKLMLRNRGGLWTLATPDSRG